MVEYEEIDQLIAVGFQSGHHIVAYQLQIVEVVEPAEVHWNLIIQPQVAVLVDDVIRVDGFVESLYCKSELLHVRVHRHLAEAEVEVIGYLVALVVSRTGFVEVEAERLAELHAWFDDVYWRTSISHPSNLL